MIPYSRANFTIIPELFLGSIPSVTNDDNAPDTSAEPRSDSRESQWNTAAPSKVGVGGSHPT